ncbi:SURF1-like protein [Roseobacter cerasinus]|uniref:SURF1-like protein n=1 Tax=Roseobacter cerasinus TaxID=2602289 RepID=A0A640VX66_9RHOB|nr:SURF1 family protein [Roseobacter cerasinus]GFE51525.1 SURF1-like protein [Roseobacter cerasinus]
MRLWFGLIVGVIGVGILVSLGIWQVQRLAWKQEVLTRIETEIAAAPVPLHAALEPEFLRYAPVKLTGTFDANHTHVRALASRKSVGAVYRIIRPFQAEDYGRILVDTGWVRDGIGELRPIPEGKVTLVGNLDAPNEADGFTPAPELDTNIWFARDVPEMAHALSTEPVLVVLRDAPDSDLGVTPWPVDTAGIPNDHLQYAITWFSLALIWGAMTVYFLLRTARSAR